MKCVSFEGPLISNLWPAVLNLLVKLQCINVLLLMVQESCTS